MVRLILEENGKRRAFRVGDGVLKIGSGAAATLRLESAGVAELHAELEISGDVGKLRVEPGVTPLSIDGETVLGEVELRQGQGLGLAGALIWIEDEAQEPGSGRPAASPAGSSAAAAAARTPARGGASAARSSAVRSSSPRSKAVVSSSGRDAARERAMSAARERGDRSAVQRSRPRAQRGMPTGVVLGIVAAVLIILGFAARKAFQVSAESTTDTQSLLRGAEEAIAEALYTKAEGKLSIINLEKATAEQKQLVNLLRTQIAEGYAKQSRLTHSSEGNRWFDVYLKKYETKYLQGDPAKARIRLFLERCKEFRKRWPEHQELTWVGRQEQRFRGAVNLSDPLTFADIDWEIQFILGGTPRRYKVAFDLIDEYMAQTGNPELDREAAEVLRKQIEEERPEQFEEAMKWASHEYDKGNDMKAVQWLVFAVAYMADPGMEKRAADYLLEMPDLKGHLEAYKRDKPDVFEALMENSIVRSKAVEFDIL